MKFMYQDGLTQNQTTEIKRNNPCQRFVKESENKYWFLSNIINGSNKSCYRTIEVDGTRYNVNLNNGIAYRMPVNKTSNSLHSPKCRYFGQLITDYPMGSLGNSVSYNADTIDQLLKLFETHHCKGVLIIRENKKTYPDFQWEIVDRINWK